MPKVPKNHNLYAVGNHSGRFHKVKTFGPSWVTLELLKYGARDLEAPRWRWKPPIGETKKVSRIVFDVDYTLKRILNV